MRILFLRNLLVDFWNNKIKLTILFVILVVIMGVFGFEKSEITVDPDTVVEVELYEESVKEYDDVITELEESIALAERQIEELDEYNTESLYMKLDPQKIFVAEIQYGIKTEQNVTNIMNSLSMFIDGGDFWDAETEEQEEISEEYVKELISCSVNGNVFRLSVMAPAQEQANTILEIIKQQLLAQKSQIEEVQGEFSIQEISSSEYVDSDIAVLNAQNTVRNNLRNYKTNLSDLKKKLIDQKTDRQNYIKNNEVEIPEDQSRVKTILKYMIFGGALGVLIPLTWFGLKYVMDNTLKSQEELLTAGIPVLGVVDRKKKKTEALTFAVLDIQLLAQKHKAEQVTINNLSEDVNAQEIMQICSEEVNKAGVSTIAGVNMQKDVGKFREMINTGNCVLIAELGRTKYVQIEEQIQLAKKFEITIWGCILVG